MRAAFGVLVLVAITGCRAPIGGTFAGTSVRARDAVRLGVSAPPEGSAIVAHGFRNDGRVTIVALPLVSGLGDLCVAAREVGADHAALVEATLGYDESGECVRHEVSLEKHPRCLSFRVDARTTAGRFRMVVIDTETCTELRGLRVEHTVHVDGPRDESWPIASRRLHDEAAARLHRLFPSQRVVDEGGRVPGATPGAGYAVFHDGAYQGVARLRDDHTLRPIAPRFEVRPNDVVLERGRGTSVELLASAGLRAPRAAGGLLPGFGLHLRGQPIDGGLQLGVSFDFARLRSDAFASVQGEIGWTFRPGWWELGPVAGLGLARMSSRPNEDSLVSGSLLASFGARLVRRESGWLFGGDLAWSQRVARTGGADLDGSGPVARIFAAFEF
jgi:hypothetical protein